MKSLVAVMFFLLCSTSFLDGQKTRLGQKQERPNPADFNVKIHISASHIRPYCTEIGSQIVCNEALFADVPMNGKKLEFKGPAQVLQHSSVLIIPGDYPARITKDVHNSDSTLLSQEYDVLLPDNRVWHCVTAGISE